MDNLTFRADSNFVRAKIDETLLHRDYIDIDGDGSGDIMLSLQNQNQYPVYPNRLTIVGDGAGSLKGFKAKGENEGVQYSQFTYISYDSDPHLALEEWGNYSEDKFENYDLYAATTDNWLSSWTELPKTDPNVSNSSQENYFIYFANDDKSVVTRLVADQGYNDSHDASKMPFHPDHPQDEYIPNYTLPEPPIYNSWTTLGAVNTETSSSTSNTDIDQYLENIELNPAINFDYKLYASGSDETLKSLAVLGQGVDESTRYNLEITGRSLLEEYAIESTDITLKFNPLIFNNITASDVTIGANLPVKNAVKIDNDQGTIRIAAASLGYLNEGGFVTSDNVLASFILDFDESTLSTFETKEDGSLEVSPLVFDIDVNHNETILSRSFDDGTNFNNREMRSLHELGAGIQVEGTEVKLYQAGIRISEQDDGLILGTTRIIGGNQGFTNLIRSGDTIEARTTWINSGNTNANNIVVSAKENANATLKGYQFKDDINSIKGGQYVNGEFEQSTQESLELTAKISITGAAGNVLNVSDGLFQLQADDSDIFTNNKGSSNLITYQGDLNYDGRVSMKDLAFLNAGAARQVTNDDGSIDAASLARDVDADFNGKIDIDDLSILDKDWGKSLHTGTSEGFTGSSDTFDWDSLDTQGDATWDNSSFKDQNAIEADSGFVGSLDPPVATGTIGANFNGEDEDIVIDGGAAQSEPLLNG